MLPSLLKRMLRRGEYRRKFGQRFGRYDADVRARLSSREWTWIHSISVGETLLAVRLARKMKELDPSLNIVLSVTTSTGFALAEKSAADWLEPIYNPLDAPPFVRRALALIRPQRLIFIEALWPNLLAGARRRGAFVSLVARLSPRSAARFERFRFFTAPVFAALDLVCVQEPEDAVRWARLGAVKEKIRVTGSIKFDEAGAAGNAGRVEEFRALLEKLGVKNDAPILLAGSTFPGEEKTIAEIFRDLRAEFPELFLILVPRHIERTSEVVADVQRAGLAFVLRTNIRTDASADCLIVNTTGELRDWYHLATVVFIGKSLHSTGGQNPVEPLLAGKPVIFGPHMENFRAIVAQLLSSSAVIQAADAAALKSEIARLLRDAPAREEMARRARAILAAHAGATERTARGVLGV